MVTWTLDTAHSSITFTIKHSLFAKLNGNFDQFSGEVHVDPADVTKSRLVARVDVASINTRQAKRDGHLRSPDFFDVAAYPEATFSSKRFVRNPDGTLQVVGDLTLHGVTREVVFTGEFVGHEFKNNQGEMRIAASASAKISRKDFGMTWNAPLDAGGKLLEDEVVITIDAALGRPGDAK